MKPQERARAGEWTWAVVGAALIALTWPPATSTSVSGLEEWVFRLFNDLPDWLETPTWPIMQAGALAVVPVVGVALFLVGRRRPAIVATLAGVAAWAIAKVIKDIVERGRPAAYLDDVSLRPAWEGLGYVSGHAAVAFALAFVLAGTVTRRWRWVVWTVAVATAVLRMYTAAHLPLDVIGGAGLGIAVAALATMIDRRLAERGG